MNSSFHRLFAGIASMVVLVALVWGFAIVGSPFTGRQSQFDDRRLQDLQAINSEVMNIVYSGKQGQPDLKPSKPIPATLQDVLDEALYQHPRITDPETNAPYEYSVTDATHYQLCAAFAFARDQQYDIFWNHPAGHACFSFDVTQPQGYGVPKGVAPMASPAVPAKG